MKRRLLFFGFGALISIIFLSMGPENRLKKTFYDYIDYFDIDKRVITHLENDSTTFTIQSECQLVYYNISKQDLLLVLDDGQVNFKKSRKDTKPCQYFVVENNVNGTDLSVEFEYCYKKNKVKVITFIANNEEKVCDY